MRYAILCYHSESALAALSESEDAAMMAEIHSAQQKIADQGKLGPVARLMPTGSAVTLRRSSLAAPRARNEAADHVVLDGPFAETKEQLLGFWIVECETLEDAIETARPLMHGGTLEIRPLLEYFPPGSPT